MKHLLETCKYFALFIFLAFLSCKLDEFQNPQSQNVLIKLPEWPPLDLHYNDYPVLDNWNVHVNYGNIDFEFSAPSFIREIHTPLLMEQKFLNHAVQFFHTPAN